MTCRPQPIILIFMLTSALAGQDNPIVQGRKLFGEQKWAEAAQVFQDAVTRDSSNGQAWFWLGLSRYQAADHEGALSALQKADELVVFPGFTRFAIARTHAKAGDGEQAFHWLGRAAASRFTNLSQLDGDEAFAPLRSDPRMKAIRDSIQRNITPADFDERYRQMDFWIGEWEVLDRNGTLQGTNSITKDLGGAVLVERWTNAFGISGMSINFYDPGTGKFKQQWVSQSGYNTAYVGEIVDGSMVMIGKNATIDGTLSTNRMTFTPNPDGTVTQFIETFNDSAQTWTPGFWGTYRRKKN